MSRLQIEARRNAAILFCKSEEKMIHYTRELLTTGARYLVNKLGNHFLTPRQYQQALGLIETGRLRQLFHDLRNLASLAVKAGISNAYWSFIDAVGFFFDATGVTWPYITDDGRRSSLRHAKLAAQDVLSELS